MNLKQQFDKRLDKNMADYHQHIMGFDKQLIFDMAVRISVVTETYKYMKESYTFNDESDIAYLLRFQNPLEIISDRWELRRQDVADMDFAMWSILDHRDADYPLMSDTPEKFEKPEKKPSVLGQLKVNEKEVKARAAPVHKAKTDQELT